MKKTMGETISNLRKEKGMTQKDLAEKMNVTDKAVSKWEQNLSCPDINSIPQLANVLDVSLETLLDVSPREQDDIYQSIRKHPASFRLVGCRSIVVLFSFFNPSCKFQHIIAF